MISLLDGRCSPDQELARFSQPRKLRVGEESLASSENDKRSYYKAHIERVLLVTAAQQLLSSLHVEVPAGHERLDPSHPVRDQRWPL